jgi:hypothetical protein
MKMVAYVLLVCLGVPSLLRAQDGQTGAIAGNVSDPSWRIGRECVRGHCR